jgi:hypothetical protein
MLPQQFWRDIEGIVIDGRFRVGDLLRAERDGLFAAEPLDSAAFDCPVAIRFMRAGAEPVLERYMEAAFFTHPHLLRCFSAGNCEISGTHFVYAVVERADTTLADIEAGRPLAVDETRKLGQQLIQALSWLHERDLIYCNLDPTTVVRIGEVWKLAEYSQLRVAGDGYTGETRRLLAISPGTPPEAWDGVVSPAWDAWSLAWVLCGAVEERRVGSREMAAARSPSRRRLSQPFASLIPECLNANVTERCGLARIEEILAGSASAKIPPPADQHPPGSVIDVAMHQGKGRRRRARFSPRRALMTALACVAGFILIATLAWHPRRASSANMVIPVAAAPPEKTIVAAPPLPRPLGEADRVIDPNSPNGLLQRWATAIRSGNIDQQVACYAPTIYAFYGASTVTPSDVRQHREEDRSRFGEARRLDISNVDVQMRTPYSAVVTFDESWEFRGHAASSGRMKERLGMRRTGEGWRITSESNVHTYYKNGPNPQS